MPHHTDLQPRLSIADVNLLLHREYPQLANGFESLRAETLGDGTALVTMEADERHLRPGNTISGPTLFTLADVAAYICILAFGGPDTLSVTTNLNINFMRKAAAGKLCAHTRILKLGKSLMVFDCDLVGPDGKTAAHATGTYSIPPTPALPASSR
ncbi:PaaI family thioesterase [Limoniibacter endophyticus]|uniref:Phenylacetic acid degradation protein n=1 Tax=Limoniibacter endophyticus TaxID=1565040 RepID=A0A8J3GIK3_9HYPH|nr:PaaI family thioesterase [Limoniibacter endophyticus]GHC79100.1 phenylacetic acid degradation protein [Limoniibacter endophyticus]